MTHANSPVPDWNFNNNFFAIVDGPLMESGLTLQRKATKKNMEKNALHPQATWPWALIQEIQERNAKNKKGPARK